MKAVICRISSSSRFVAIWLVSLGLVFLPASAFAEGGLSSVPPTVSSTDTSTTSDDSVSANTSNDSAANDSSNSDVSTGSSESSAQASGKKAAASKQRKELPDTGFDLTLLLAISLIAAGCGTLLLVPKRVAN